MYKTVALFFGLLLLATGVYSLINLHTGKTRALSMDKSHTAFGEIMGPPPCTWSVTPPNRVVNQNSSFSVLVSVDNKTSADCSSEISLRAPGFIISPQKDTQQITLPKGRNGSISWIIAPVKTGTYQVAVSDVLNTKSFGVSVTNTFGLNEVQAQLLSWVGSIFGPMLTFPFWWEKWRQRKQASSVSST